MSGFRFVASPQKCLLQQLRTTGSGWGGGIGESRGEGDWLCLMTLNHCEGVTASVAADLPEIQSDLLCLSLPTFACLRQ